MAPSGALFSVFFFFGFVANSLNRCLCYIQLVRKEKGGREIKVCGRCLRIELNSEEEEEDNKKSTRKRKERDENIKGKGFISSWYTRKVEEDRKMYKRERERSTQSREKRRFELLLKSETVIIVVQSLQSTPQSVLQPFRFNTLLFFFVSFDTFFLTQVASFVLTVFACFLSVKFSLVLSVPLACC